MNDEKEGWRAQQQKLLQERRRNALEAEYRRKSDVLRQNDDVISRHWGQGLQQAPNYPVEPDEDLDAMSLSNTNHLKDRMVADLKELGGHDLLYIKQTTTILTAAQMLTENKIGLVLVVDDEGALAGVLSERDIVRAIATDGPSGLTRAVHSIITHDVVTCKSTDSIADVAQVMSARRFRHMPIVDDGVLRGMISATDIVAQLASPSKA